MSGPGLVGQIATGNLSVNIRLFAINFKWEVEMETNSEMLDEIDIRFKYHAPKLDQPDRYNEMRSLAKRMAVSIVRLSPSSRERSLALTKLDEVVMWANAAIARRE